MHELEVERPVINPGLAAYSIEDPKSGRKRLVIPEHFLTLEEHVETPSTCDSKVGFAEIEGHTIGSIRQGYAIGSGEQAILGEPALAGLELISLLEVPQVVKRRAPSKKESVAAPDGSFRIKKLFAAGMDANRAFYLEPLKQPAEVVSVAGVGYIQEGVKEIGRSDTQLEQGNR